MRMIKPTEQDMDSACQIMTAILNVEQGNSPRCHEIDSTDPDEYLFDEHNKDHLVNFYKIIMKEVRKNPQALMRVIGGMCFCVMYDENEIVDPDSEHLALHPTLKRVNADT